MKKSRLLLLIALMSAIAAVPASAQETVAAIDFAAPPLRFSHIKMNDGLGVPHVYAVAQDERGFMWFGSNGTGFYRYDGHQFVQYSRDPDDPDSLPNDQTNDLLFASDGVLWIATVGGLSRLDVATDSLVHFIHNPDDPGSILPGSVREIDEDADGGLWVASDAGVSYREPSTGRFARYEHDPGDPQSLREGNVWSVCVDSRGSVWVGTSTGLSRLDRATGSFVHYDYAPGAASGIGPGGVLSIVEDPNGVVWVGTWGLSRYDRNADRFETYFPDPRYPHREQMPEPSAVNVIRSITDDGQGGLWLGASSGSWSSTGGGLYRFDPSTETFTFYRHDPTDPYSLGSDHVFEVYRDRQGILWVATDAGLSRTDPTAGYFRLYRPGPATAGGLRGRDSLPKGFADRAGVLWISVGRVLNRIDPERRKIRYYDADAAPPGSVPVWIQAMLEDREGSVWFASYGGGLYRLRRGSERFERFTHDPSDPASLVGNIVTRLHEDRDGILWVGARYRVGQPYSYWLHRMDPQTGRFDRFFIGENIELYDFCEDSAGALWVVGRPFGLLRIDRETGAVTLRMEHDPDAEQSIYLPSSITERAKEPGVLWVGTYGDGLIQFDTRTGELTRYTAQRHGLTSNSMNGLAVDVNDVLWLATERGITRFDPDTGEMRHYDETNGVQDLEFVPRPTHVSAEGEIFFGGRGGVNAFFPDEIRDNPHPPAVALLSLRAGGSTVSLPPGATSAPVRSGTVSPVELPYARNDLTIAYVGLHFGVPEKNHYTYRLEGYDEAWSDTTDVRRATYTNLPPGAYTFRVKAANSDGVWNEEGASLKITVLPPWWRTAWAYAVYALLMIGAVVGAYRWQHHRIVRREREAARERDLEQAREIERAYHQLEEAHHDLEQTHRHLQTTQQQLVQSEKMASLGALTAGIAHEIKNPLNFVNNFAEVNEELAQELRDALAGGGDVEDLLADLERNASVIAQHGKRADAIVQSMMQHASGGSGEREPTEVNALVGEYVELAYHGKRAQTPGFRVEIDRDLGAEVGRVEMVPQEIGRVLLNLLSNAFDAVAETEHPRVQVSTRLLDGQVEIRVCDNGSGIPAAVREKIFEPFFTTKPTGSGTGLGLSLAYDIVTQGHRGTIEVESAEGEGATFVVTLPA